MAEIVQRYDIAVGRVKDRRRTAQGGLIAHANLTRVGVFEYRNPDGTIRREYRPPDEVFAPDALASLSHATLTDDHPSRVTPDNWRRVSIGHVIGTPGQDGDFVASDIALQHADAIDKAENGGLVEASCGYECEIDPTPGVSPDGKPYDVIQRRHRYNHVAFGPVGWGRAGPDVRMRLDSAGISGADWPDVGARADAEMDPEEWLGREIATAVAAALEQLGGEIGQDEKSGGPPKQDSRRADDWDESQHPRDEGGRFASGGGGGGAVGGNGVASTPKNATFHAGASQHAQHGSTYASRVAAHQLNKSISDDTAWEGMAAGEQPGMHEEPKGRPNFALLHEPGAPAPSGPIHPSHFGGVGGLLAHAASKIRGAAAAIGKAGIDEVKEKLHDFGHAASGVKNFLTGKPVSPEEKKAIKRVVVTVAAYVIASHVAPLLPLHHLIHGEAAAKTLEKVAHFVVHTVGEKLSNRGLHLDSLLLAGMEMVIRDGAVVLRADEAPTQAEREEMPEHQFGDPENKKYPLDTPEHVRAASSYVEKEHNAGRLSDAKYKEIRARINKAREKHGIGEENQDSTFYVRAEMPDTAHDDPAKQTRERIATLEQQVRDLTSRNDTLQGQVDGFRETEQSANQARDRADSEARADAELDARLAAIDTGRRLLGSKWGIKRADGRVKSVVDIQREVIEHLSPGADLKNRSAEYIAGKFDSLVERADAAARGRAAMQFASPFGGAIVREDARRRMGKQEGAPDMDPDDEEGGAGGDDVQDARAAMFQRQKDAYKTNSRRGDRRRGFGAPNADSGKTVPMRSAFGGGNQGDNAGEFGVGLR